MRTLIFGAKGQLGRDLMQVFAREGEVKGYDLPELDIADEVALQPVVEQFSPDLIVNAAAYTNVEQAEDDIAGAFLCNETGARNVAELAAYHHIPVVYYSTDYVFCGQSEAPYLTDTPMAPLGVYGKSKAAGETATRRANPHHYILRTAWLYGPGGNNFVEKIIQAAMKHSSLKVVEDEVGSPTHTLDLAEATRDLVHTETYGTYHVVNRGACTRFEFAQAILKRAGMDVPIHPCASSEFPTKAERPLYSVLDTAKVEEVMGRPMRAWLEALEDYMHRREN